MSAWRWVVGNLGHSSDLSDLHPTGGCVDFLFQDLRLHPTPDITQWDAPTVSFSFGRDHLGRGCDGLITTG